jgi:hypothetical protein
MTKKRRMMMQSGPAIMAPFSGATDIIWVNNGEMQKVEENAKYRGEKYLRHKRRECRSYEKPWVSLPVSQPYFYSFIPNNLLLS